MDIYQKKYNQKLILLIVAVVIGLVTLLYTNNLANKIAGEEKQKAKLWAEAISSRAKLVKYTNNLFTRLAEEERGKVSVWAKATEFLITVEDNDQLNFFSEIVTGNHEIPVILTDETGKIKDVRNFEISDKSKWYNINQDSFASFRKYQPIAIKFLNRKNYIYYDDSNLFSELKKTLNDLISSFISEVVLNTASAPVLLTDDKMNLIASGNLDSIEVNTPAKLLERIKQMELNHTPILVDLGEGNKKYIYYDDSLVLKQLRLFPYIQMGIFGLFLFFSYFAFNNARRAEQNLVWVGMAKETAHQLGTPISSLSGWVEYLRESDSMKGNENIIQEMDADVDRLTLVADRFSKIGSTPKLSQENVKETMERNIAYIQKRSSKDAQFELICEDEFLVMNINIQLFDWVMENLFKNSLDAMNGLGKLTITVHEFSHDVAMDVTDTGCGITKNKFKTIFEPGFSTKRRGWGLGLSLTRRIVEDYHHGKIFVKNSELGKGTTIRVQIPKA